MMRIIVWVLHRLEPAVLRRSREVLESGSATHRQLRAFREKCRTSGEHDITGLHEVSEDMQQERELKLKGLDSR